LISQVLKSGQSWIDVYSIGTFEMTIFIQISVDIYTVNKGKANSPLPLSSFYRTCAPLCTSYNSIKS